MKRYQKIIIRLPLLPFHAVIELSMFILSILMVILIEFLEFAIENSKKLPNMAWYLGKK